MITSKCLSFFREKEITLHDGRAQLVDAAARVNRAAKDLSQTSCPQGRKERSPVNS